MSHEMDKQLERIRRAYDLTVGQYELGFDPLSDVPPDLKDDPEFHRFLDEAGESCHSGAPDVREYLEPGPGMRFLDLGCAASLNTHRFFEWKSEYYGVDISPLLIEAMRKFASGHSLDVGGLHVADAANLPFADDYFDIAAMVGVLEYCNFEYVQAALNELSRVLRAGARTVIDIPNMAHRHVDLMFSLEESLSRPPYAHERSAFEEVLARRFDIDRIDTSRVMLKYYCRTRSQGQRENATGAIR